MHLSLKKKFIFSFLVLILVFLVSFAKPSVVFAEDCSPGQQGDVCTTKTENGNACAQGHRYCVWDSNGNYWGDCSEEVNTCGAKVTAPTQEGGVCADHRGRDGKIYPDICEANVLYSPIVCADGSTYYQSKNQACHTVGPCNGIGAKDFEYCRDSKITEKYICSDGTNDYVYTDRPCEKSSDGTSCGSHGNVVDQYTYCQNNMLFSYLRCSDGYRADTSTGHTCDSKDASSPPPPAPQPPAPQPPAPPPLPTQDPNSPGSIYDRFIQADTAFRAAHGGRRMTQTEWVDSMAKLVPMGTAILLGDKVYGFLEKNGRGPNKAEFVQMWNSVQPPVASATPVPSSAPAAPTTTNNVTCVSGSTYSGSEVTVNWSGTGVTRVEIAGDHFSTILASSYPTNYYKKDVTGTSTIAPAGFTKADGSGRVLNLTAGQTVYVRVCTSTQCSPETAFSVPVCAAAATPTAAPSSAPACKGDFNKDGQVSDTDLDIWKNSYLIGDNTIHCGISGKTDLSDFYNWWINKP